MRLLILVLFFASSANAQPFIRFAFSVPVNPVSHGTEVGGGYKLRLSKQVQPFVEISMINRWDKYKENLWIKRGGLLLFQTVSITAGQSTIVTKPINERWAKVHREYSWMYGVDVHFWQVDETSKMFVGFVNAGGNKYLSFGYKGNFYKVRNNGTVPKY